MYWSQLAKLRLTWYRWGVMVAFKLLTCDLWWRDSAKWICWLYPFPFHLFLRFLWLHMLFASYINDCLLLPLLSLQQCPSPQACDHLDLKGDVLEHMLTHEGRNEQVNGFSCGGNKIWNENCLSSFFPPPAKLTCLGAPWGFFYIYLNKTTGLVSGCVLVVHIYLVLY